MYGGDVNTAANSTGILVFTGNANRPLAQAICEELGMPLGQAQVGGVRAGGGRPVFRSEADRERALLALRYVDNHGRVAQAYPANPNGSPDGVTGFTTADGRFTIMMPHPERTARTLQMSWAPQWLVQDSPDASPWLRMFRNARVWLG